MSQIAAALAVVLSLALAGSGCGLGPGPAHGGATVLVTRDFGSRTLGRRTATRLRASDTVMRLLEGEFPVATRYGGGFVQSIAGLAGGTDRGHPVDWFYYVNGIEAPQGAAATRAHPGDRVWWDRHDWSATQTIPAVVGSYPEPFLDGIDGHRLPLRIDCAPDATAACRVVASRLSAAGVVASQAALGAPAGQDVARVLVGSWTAVSADGAARSIQDGPGSSGVYARFASSGDQLQLLDPAGHVARVLGAGTGLVAATRYHGQAPAWLVTGTDTVGVGRAARALDPGVLGGHFALALTATGGAPAPVVSG